jgi:hypothetical protein
MCGGGRARSVAGAPKRENFVYQATLDAIDFIQGRAKGDKESLEDLFGGIGGHGAIKPSVELHEVAA